jgi:hypothetical protein
MIFLPGWQTRFDMIQCFSSAVFKKIIIKLLASDLEPASAEAFTLDTVGDFT